MLPGLDVSYWEGKIDWRVVASAGYKFAYAKSTESTTYFDETFLTNINGAQAAGLPVGAYHFYRLSASAKDQAQFFLKKIKDIPLDLPIALDFEEQASQPPASVAASLKTWLDIVTDKTGRKPLIYTSSYYWNTYVGTPDWAPTYQLWVANYTAAPEPLLPKSWTNYLIWQYTDKGAAPGVTTPVDLDRFHGSEQDLAALTGKPFVAPVTLEERVAKLEKDLAALQDMLHQKGVL